MNKIIIFGNSGSGKSTLARELSESKGLAHLDLDTIAWEATIPPERRSLSESALEISKFIDSNTSWVIEGCYTDLLELIAPHSSEIIFLNLSIDECVSNARKRPWEPHKYKSQEEQDANLEMLTAWIEEYVERDDTFSEKSHKKFYDDYQGTKNLFTSNERST